LLPFAGRPAVGDAVPADDDGEEARIVALDVRQRPHEDVEAAIGLEVAGAVGEHRRGARQQSPVGQAQADVVLRLQGPGVDALVQDVDLAADRRGEEVALPARRGDAEVGVVLGVDLGEVAQAEELAVLVRHRELRVEAVIRAPLLVVEFQVGDEAGRRPDLAQEEEVTPARVADDDVGLVARLRQPGHQRRGGAPLADLVGERLERRKARIDAERAALVAMHLHARQRGDCDRMAADGGDVEAGGGEAGCDQLVLAGQVRMDEEQLQCRVRFEQAGGRPRLTVRAANPAQPRSRRHARRDTGVTRAAATGQRGRSAPSADAGAAAVAPSPHWQPGRRRRASPRLP
jgi:hypothetical protein